LPKRSDGGDEPIGTAQKRAVGRTAPHPLAELTDQWHVAMFTDLAREPQARLDHHRQRHPDDAPLGLDAELIGLDVPEFPGLLDQMLLHGLPLEAGTGLSRRDRPLVKPTGHDDRLPNLANTSFLPVRNEADWIPYSPLELFTLHVVISGCYRGYV